MTSSTEAAAVPGSTLITAAAHRRPSS